MNARPWYLILAKQSPNEPHCQWWLPHGSGHTPDVTRAARYREEHARALAHASGGECFAIPLHVAEQWALSHVPASSFAYVLESAARASSAPPKARTR